MYLATEISHDLNLERKLKSASKPPACPWCNSRRIAIVLGGMPVYIPELESELDNSETSIHGLPKSNGDPTWQCTECGAQFFREMQTDHSLD
jgi:DNA-directed RNA polymerase subunit RPC12/RpoP